MRLGRPTRLLVTFTLVVLAACLIATPSYAAERTVPPEEGNGWYYSNLNPYYRYPGLAPTGTTYGGEYVIGNCTWYAWGRASEMAGEAIRVSGAPEDMWYEAEAAGYTRSMTPRAGDLCVGMSNANPHVSTVEYVKDGVAYVTESGYRTRYAWPGFQDVVFHAGPADEWMKEIWGYIHIQDHELTSNPWERIAGANAYDTMSAIVRSDGAFAEGSGGTVVVATGNGYWDALSASGVAGLAGGPVLITNPHALSSQARSEIERINPSKIVVAGGPLAVSDDVFAELQRLCPNVVRAYGQAADDTSVDLFEEGKELGTWGSTAIVATSNGYWDALSIAPYAYAGHAPIFLTNNRDGGGQVLSASVLDAISSGSFTRVVIVGGSLAVSDSVEGQLEEVGVTEIVRLAGQTALDTSAAIVAWELEPSQDMGTWHLAVATSGGYWDALTGAALAGKQNSVLVLVDNNGHCQALEAALGHGDLTHGHVLGGTMAISADTWNEIVSRTS